MSRPLYPLGRHTLADLSDEVLAAYLVRLGQEARAATAGGDREAAAWFETWAVWAEAEQHRRAARTRTYPKPWAVAV